MLQLKGLQTSFNISGASSLFTMVDEERDGITVQRHPGNVGSYDVGCWVKVGASREPSLSVMAILGWQLYYNWNYLKHKWLGISVWDFFLVKSFKAGRPLLIWILVISMVSHRTQHSCSLQQMNFVCYTVHLLPDVSILIVSGHCLIFFHIKFKLFKHLFIYCVCRWACMV